MAVIRLTATVRTRRAMRLIRGKQAPPQGDLRKQARLSYTLPAAAIGTRELLDRRTRFALRFGFAGSGPDHPVAAGIFYKPEPRVLGVPDLEADPQVIFANTHCLIFAENLYQSPLPCLIYSRSGNRQIDNRILPTAPDKSKSRYRLKPPSRRLAYSGHSRHRRTR